MLDSFRPIETSKILDFRFLTDQSFHVSIVIGFICIALFSLSILHFCNHISHSVSHTTRIHFTKLSSQLDLKIDWFIFEVSRFQYMMFFLMCKLLKIGNIFLREMVDNKCANIFSTIEVDLSFQSTLTHEKHIACRNFFVSLRSILCNLN